MELALIGSLAFIGYEISRSGKTIKSKEVKKHNINEKSYPFQKDPLLSNDGANIDYNKFQPFRKDKGIHLSFDSNVQTRSLENFSGVNNNYKPYCTKKEQPPLFAPQKQNIYGNQGVTQDLIDRDEGAPISNMMNNVSPIEQQQVGPGLNTSSDISARGGFHQYFRILPTNVGEYKKNNFEGRVISGKGITENRTMQSKQDVYKSKSYYEQCEHPTMQSKAVFNAPATQSAITPDCTNRGSYSNHAGGAKGAESFQSRIHGTRPGNITLDCLPTGGAARENAATGGYAVSRYLTHETDREDCGVVTNVNDQNSGNYVKGNQIANMTQREGTSKAYSGAAGFYNNAQSNYSTAYNADPYHKREDVQVSYTPNPGNMNIRQDAQQITGSMKIRQDCNGHRVNIATVPNSMNLQGKPGKIENAPKVTECNPRQDFGLVAKTLENNPYVVR